MSSIRVYSNDVTYKQSLGLILSIFHCHRFLKSQVYELLSVQGAVFWDVAPFLLLLLVYNLPLYQLSSLDCEHGSTNISKEL